VTFTLTFCYVSPIERDFTPLLDERGQEITIQVDVPSKSATFHHPDVVTFCTNQGNDCRVRGVT
jgi:hypothetical protein